MRIEPKLIDARTEPILNDNSLVLWLNDNGKTNSMWRDYSGKNNHGTVYGAGTPPAATPGTLGYTFDGVDDIINIGNPANLNFNENSNYTLSGWVKTPWNGEVKYKSLFGTSTRHGINIRDSDGTVYFGIRSAADSGHLKLSSTVVPNNIWTHLAIVHNATSKIVYLYKNGFLVDQITPHDLTSITLIGAWYIGSGSIGGVSIFFSGSINDVRFYNINQSNKIINLIFNLERGKYGV